MKKYYFKSLEVQGVIYIQLRCFSNYESDKWYEGIIILIDHARQPIIMKCDFNRF